MRWALAPRVSAPSSVPATRYRAVRGFARYMAGIDAETEIPPAGLVRRPRSRSPPFIYTDEELLALLAHARASIPQPLRAATMQTLIGLLASSGLRVGEALRLDRGDIDWSDGVLHIRQSKFRKSRLVPLAPSVLEALERYAHLRDRERPAAAGESFFVSLRGTRVIHACVWKTFASCATVPGSAPAAACGPRSTTSDTASLSACSSIGIAMRSTFSRASPGSQPTSGIAIRSRATGTCPPRRSCSRTPPTCSMTHGR